MAGNRCNLPPCSLLSTPPVPSLPDFRFPAPRWISKNRYDARSHGVEHGAVRHLRSAKGELNFEAIPLPARNQVNVEVKDILPRRRPARNYQIHSLGLRCFVDHRPEHERHPEEMFAECPGQFFE